MRRFARRLSQAVVYPITRTKPKATHRPRAVLERPSVASIFYFDDDQNYLNRLGLRRRPSNSESDNDEHPTATTTTPIVIDEEAKHKSDNVDQLGRSIKFLSVMYAILLVIVGSLCSFLNINKPENPAGDLFLAACSLVGFLWLVFLHYDIVHYKRWVLSQVKSLKPQVDKFDEASKPESIDEKREQEFDRASLTTAYIFDFFQKKKKAKVTSVGDDDEASTFSQGGYRFFLGKHSNDFYLKIGMIIFCFGYVLHLAVGLVQQINYIVYHYYDCQNWSKMLNSTCGLIYAFYQLFIAFKYSNIIIDRHKNVARFALMHLIGTAISIWLDSIADEAIEDYVTRKLADHANATHDDLDLILLEKDYQLREHIVHQHHCSELDILNSKSMNAMPYLYPFAIEFNIALASVWLMLFFNIGNIHHKALFKIPGDRGKQDDEDDDDDDEDDDDLESGRQRRKSYARGLSMNIDCSNSNRGLFLGLAILLLCIITIIVFFATIHKGIYTSIAVFTYSVQIAVLTVSCFVVIFVAFRQIRKLDIVHQDHRDNAFTMMDDILVLIPIPFYFVHHTLCSVATVYDHSGEYEANNYLLAAIDILTVLQVMIQSPFIVDGLRRCANRSQVRFKKPGRELITFLLILNVALWILNTFELKSVEVYQASHHYFGEFNSMILSHTTLPLMLFYRFHSSVCLSNIWKYAYEKDE